MFIEKYWGNYIGATDDSLNLVAYLADKNKPELSLAEIFTDLGLDKLAGDYTETTVPLEFMLSNGICLDFHFAIDIITDLAAILLECQGNGTVDLHDLDPYDTDHYNMCIITTPQEKAEINQTLKHFAENPMAYDSKELVPENDMLEMAAVCEQLREALES